MKTLIACFAALLFVAATERPLRADNAVPVDVFYDALAPYGDWVDVEGYGYCFRPNAALEDPSWRPYTEGAWVYTDAGWTWESDEDFGWATYHYGRWFLVGDTWVWTPGDGIWGPAWVSWRTSDEYVGWAPLPPDAYWQEDTGFGVYVDIDYDIGPACYSFVPIRYLGDRHLRHWVEPWQRNVEYVRLTENRTRITHRTTNNYITQIYNDGPDYTLLSRRSEQPIRRLSLAQQDNVSFRDRGSRLRNTVQNDSLRVIAPRVEKVEDRSLKPKNIATHLDRSKVHRGWERYNAEEVRDLRTKFETAKRDNNREGRDPNRAARTGDQPATTAASTDPNTTSKNRDRDRDPKSGDRVLKALPADPTAAAADQDAKSKKMDRNAKTEDQPPKALPSDRTAASAASSAEDRMRARTGNDQRKIDSTTPSSADDRKSKQGAAEREEMRKAVPVSPESTSKGRSKKDADDTPKPRKIEPLDPGRPGSPERFRGGPQDMPPRSQIAPGAAGITRPDENPPGPSRKMIPGENSGNTQRSARDSAPKLQPKPDLTPKVRPSEDSLPRMKRDGDVGPKVKPGRSDDNVPRIAPQPRIQPQPQLQPQARTVEPRKVEPRKIEAPKQEAPKPPARVQVPQSAPPQAVAPGAGAKPGKGAGNKSDEDDKKKKPH